MKSAAVSYKSELLQDLRDPRNCAEYLSFCLAESNETFLLGLKNVVEAQGGMTKLATAASVNRENLYKMLSEQGNPTLDSLVSILMALGFHLDVAPIAATTSNVMIPAVKKTQADLESYVPGIGSFDFQAAQAAQGYVGSDLTGMMDMGSYYSSTPATIIVDSISEIGSVPDGPMPGNQNIPLAVVFGESKHTYSTTVA